jgi:thiaminase (transcriptional activator TenA)
MAMPGGSASARMRSDSAAIWDGLHAHPFLREIADGSLPLEKFRFFLEQDDLYLAEYARCLGMAAARSRDEAELRGFTTDLSAALEAELPSNRELLARVVERGAADCGGAGAMAPATLAYTSYLQALAMRGTSLDIMSALLPCAWSYVEIAQELEPRANDHEVYADWIAFFASEDNVALIDDMRDALDRLVETATPDDRRFAELSDAFATSSRLERAFWDMSYSLGHWPDLTPSRASAAAPVP